MYVVKKSYTTLYHERSVIVQCDKNILYYDNKILYYVTFNITE